MKRYDPKEKDYWQNDDGTYEDEDGIFVFRTVGGRIIRIYENQDLATAMKKSGKFNTTKTKEEKYNKQSMIEAQNKIEKEFKNDGYLDEDEYYDKIAKEYAEIENRSAQDPDIKQQIRDIKNQLKKDNSYERLMKKINGDNYENKSEKELDLKRSRYDIKVNGPDTDTIINDFEDKVVSKYDNNMTQDEKKRAIDSYVNRYKAQGEPMRNISAEDVKDVLYDNYRIQGRFKEDDKLSKGDSYVNKQGTRVDILEKDDKGQTLHKFTTSDGKTDYKNYNEKDVESMLKHNGYEKQVNESNVRKLFDKDKIYNFNDNVKNENEWKEKNKKVLEKGYKEETGTDPYKNGKEKTSFKDYQTWRYGKEVDRVNGPYRKAFQEYKKQHPNTKLTLNKFIDMSEGK